MKIHGTAKGGAISKKDFGVAFGGAAAGTVDLTGLLVYFKMAQDETPIDNSSTSDDSLGSAGELIVTGGTFQQSGIGGSDYSLLFDGTDDTANIASSQSLFKFLYDDDWNFTINFWFKKSTTGGSGEDIMINSRGSNNGVQMKFAEAGVANSPCFVWKARCDEAGWIDKQTPADTLPQNTDWHMCTIKGQLSNPQASAVNITIDNTASYDLARGDLPSGSENADLLLYIASENNESGFWAGYLTEWSIWNRVLTSEELTTIYNNGSDGIPQ